VRGVFHAIKVALGPELNACGLWKMTPTERELLYHERQIVGVGGSAAHMRAMLDPQRHDEIVPSDIRPYLRLYVPLGGRVLDVGSGPISLLTGGHRQERYELTATDLLTESYQALLRSYGHEQILRGVRYVSCQGELLASKLEANYFDVVSCNNALDHMESPRTALEQMATVTRPGGVIIISGHSREGTHERWEGMHRHDLWLERGVLWRCGQNGADKRNLTEGLSLDYVDGIEPKHPHGDMVAVFKKRLMV
jgi:SAM-dependent methyltransferase